jgi:hypothetical protein
MAPTLKLNKLGTGLDKLVLCHPLVNAAGRSEAYIC